MQKIFFIIASLAVVIFLNGCGHHKPKPESNISIINSVNPESITVSNAIPESEPFFVQYQIKGKDIYIECIVKGISFRKNSSHTDQAKIAVYVDGKKLREVNSAAFSIKDLPSGNHRIKMSVVTLKNKTFGKPKEFTVTIP